MARSYDITDLITLPRLDATGADALVTELLSQAKGQKQPAPVVTARKALEKAQKGLKEAIASRLQVLPASDSARAREADQAEDAAFSAMNDWLNGFAKLPDSLPQSGIARRLLGTLFRDGLKFTQLPFKLEWAEADARLRAIDADASITADLHKLGGDVFLSTLRSAHKAYGEALGITSAKSAETPTALTLKEPLDAVRSALRTYTLRVLAHVEGDETEIATQTSALLGPLVEWQSRAAKSPKAEPAPQPDPGPAASPTPAAAGAESPDPKAAKP